MQWGTASDGTASTLGAASLAQHVRPSAAALPAERGHVLQPVRGPDQMRRIIICLECGAGYWFYCIGHMHVCWCGSRQFTKGEVG